MRTATNINSSFYNQSKVVFFFYMGMFEFLKSFSIQITSKIKKDQYFFLNVSVFDTLQQS